MNEELASKLRDTNAWTRILYIVMFGLVLYVAAAVVLLVVLLLVVFTLLTGERDARMQGFAASLAEYVAQVLRYITYNTDVRPFPFSDWPAPPQAGAAKEGDTPAD